MALGENPLELWELRREKTKAGLAKMIFETEKSGILKSIEYKGKIEGNVREVTLFKQPGDEINIFENSKDCIGQIIVEGDTMKECKELLQDVLDQIEIVLQ